MKNIKKIGGLFYLGQDMVRIDRFLDFKKAIITRIQKNVSDVVELRLLKSEPTEESKLDDSIYMPMLESISDKDWEIAQKRFSIIEPIIQADRSGRIIQNRTNWIQEIAKTNGVGKATIYRWLIDYNSTGLVSSLIPLERNGGKGESRMSSNAEMIINDCIRELYLNSQNKSAAKVILGVQSRCKTAGIESPHENTIRNRISRLSQSETFNTRAGKTLTQNRVDPVPGKSPLGNHPLDVVQIDHTLLDIIVVTEKEREPIGRPWITMGIDVFSRMITGFYVSLDPPGALGTGVCISNSILPKDFIIAKYNLKSDWPICGVMETIHLDNAKEFRGTMLQRACKEYVISINWRPVKKPHWGAHIERLLGTLARDIHALPGTTFSNPSFRKNYNSEKNSAMTLEELEKWLYTYIVDVYHQRLHSGIKTSPINRYSEGIFGSAEKEGIGIQTYEFDEEKVKLDFLPFFERVIRRTGVTIDHITYYHEILKKYLYDSYSFRGDDFSKNKMPAKFVFKRDPRDISKIFFLDPTSKRYVAIPYADATKPGISIWEYREALRFAKKNNPHIEIDQDKIFEAYGRLQEIEKGAQKMKREARKSNRERKLDEFNPKRHVKLTEEINYQQEGVDLSSLTPFETDDTI